MKRPPIMLAATLFAGFAALPVLAQPGAPIPPRAVISSPDWVRRPTPSDMERYYPQGALKAEISGTVRLQCTVVADGELDDCTVVTEQPPGAGFGAAALAVAPLFQMRPTTRDGQPVAGATVVIPVVFRVGAPPPVTNGPPPPPLPVPPVRRTTPEGGQTGRPSAALKTSP